MEELRRIMFSDEELLSAFRSYARKTPGPISPDDMVSCTPIEDPNLGPAVKVKVRPNALNPKESEIFYRGTDVLQRLILFCLENNVKLPRAGRKTFEIYNFCGSVIIRLNLELELTMEEDPMKSTDIENIKGGPEETLPELQPELLN